MTVELYRHPIDKENIYRLEAPLNTNTANELMQHIPFMYGIMLDAQNIFIPVGELEDNLHKVIEADFLDDNEIRLLKADIEWAKKNDESVLHYEGRFEWDL